ncbi:MAG: hypothetical protein KC731_42560, partial [Myxococcales bacterium]|nr:hypothetical protein [Myxococcales bacterium]
AARQPISPPPPSSIVAPPIPSGYLPQPPASPPSAHPIGATAVGGIPALPDEALPFDDRAPAVAPPPSVVPVPHPMAGATSFVPSLSNADLGASVDVTMPPSVRPDARQLPFVGSREAPPSQAPPLDPAPSVGATAFVSISELDLASALPFGDAARGAIDVTAAGGIPALEDPIPFDGTGSAPPPAPEAVAPRVTSGTAVAKATSSAPLPFVAAASTEPPLLPGGLTLRQLASLTVEMELSFARMNELFAAYGLTMATYQAHKKAVAELVARDPSAQVRWNEATHAYRHWRTGR